MRGFHWLERKSWPWFTIAIAALLCVSCLTRFWGLGRFNVLVFDEVYFAKFANNYLTQTPFFDAHPPLSKYLIAIGIWLGEHVFFKGAVLRNSLVGASLSPLSYRWMNALLGSFLPAILMGIAYQLTRRRSYTLIVGGLALLDGLLLVESRYAFTNIYLLTFGLLGQLCFLLALNQAGVKRWGWMIGAGLSFGCAASVKWNGLWFLLGIYFIGLTAWAMRLLAQRRFRGATLPPLFDRVTRLNILGVLGCLAVLPVALYSLLWIPHLQQNPTFNFWEMQRQILAYHQRVGGNESTVHPYCSPWYTWLWMVRPIAYLYETARSLTDVIPLKPALPVGEVKVVYFVSAMGNPVLWWLSTIAIVVLLGILVQRIQDWLTNTPVEPQSGTSVLGLPDNNGVSLWIMVYLVANYAANLLPWVRVTRCTFLYHYMGAAVFSLLATAWFIDAWLQSHQPKFRFLGLTALFLILIAFVFWLPIYLGLPLSPAEVQLRRWFPGW